MRVACVLALTLPVLGCVFAPRMHYEARDVPTTAPYASGEEQELVGVALSGGGSRAALFAAAGLEALWEHGLVDRVDYISSVSGGSIAAGYFVKTTVAENKTVDEELFDRFKELMRSNFWSSMEWRQCYKIRWLSSTRRSISLKEVLDKRFLDGLTHQKRSAVRPHACPPYRCRLPETDRRSGSMLVPFLRVPRTEPHDHWD